MHLGTDTLRGDPDALHQARDRLWAGAGLRTPDVRGLGEVHVAHLREAVASWV
jgi:hypothetical protein